jgi:uncharacterized RDD family membrane protein YckC
MKYHVARQGEKLGEFSDLEISAGLRDGQFKPDDLCWAASMADWESIKVHFELPEVSLEPEQVAAIHDLRSQEPELALASLGERFFAWLVDSVTLLPGVLLLLNAAGLEHAQSMEALLAEMESRPQDFEAASWWFILLGVVNVLLLSHRGQTLGKLVTGIRVVMFQTGLPAGFVRAVILRSFVMMMLGSVRYVGLGLQAFDVALIFRQGRRCLHDHIADTMVVRSRKGKGS